MRTKTSKSNDLPWIKHLLVKDSKDNLGAGVLHYLAWSGDVETVLTLGSGTKLLGAKTYSGLNIAHYAAWSGESEQLQKLFTQHPELPIAKTNYGLNIAHYAALSGKTEALDCVKKYHPKFLMKWSRGTNENVAHFAA